MPYFSTTYAFYFLYLIFVENFLFLLFIFINMFLKSASRSILFLFATTPPHKTTPLALMSITAPIKVFVFFIFLITSFAVKYCEIYCFSLLLFLNFCSHSNSFLIQVLNFFFFCLNRID